MSTTLVIGASRGLGFEFVKQLRDRSCRVVATARSASGLVSLAGLGAEAIFLDIEDPESLSTFVERFDAPDLTNVIHNAGVFGSEAGTALPADSQEFHRVMSTNVLAPLLLIPQLGPMISATQGRYVFLSSDMGSITGVDRSNGVVYRASKAALNMLVRCAALEFPMAVFTAISPGWVRTDMGGPEAPLSTEESVLGMLKVIEERGIANSGEFVDYRGHSLPW